MSQELKEKYFVEAADFSKEFFKEIKKFHEKFDEELLYTFNLIVDIVAQFIFLFSKNNGWEKSYTDEMTDSLIYDIRRRLEIVNSKGQTNDKY